MSSMAKTAREAMKAKANRLGSDRQLEKVDSSTWTPPGLLNAQAKTGMRPISKPKFKKGGKISGQVGVKHAGRKARKSGGRALSADSLINRDVKEANEQREGIKHIGALKRGGKAMRKARNTGGDAIAEYLEKNPLPQEKMPLPVPRPKSLDKPEPAPKYKDKYDLTTQGAKRGGKIEKCWGGETKGRTEKMMGGSMMGGGAGVSDKAFEFQGNPVTPGLKRGGKAMRKGREDGGGANYEGVPIKKIPIGVSGLSPADAEKWKKQTDTSGMGWRAGYKPNDVNGEAKKRGGRAGKAGGGMLETVKRAIMAVKAGQKGRQSPLSQQDKEDAMRADQARGVKGYLGLPRKKGGKVHEDVAADKALIKKMVKPSARTGKADGGSEKWSLETSPAYQQYLSDLKDRFSEDKVRKMYMDEHDARMKDPKYAESQKKRGMDPAVNPFADKSKSLAQLKRENDRNLERGYDERMKQRDEELKARFPNIRSAKERREESEELPGSVKVGKAMANLFGGNRSGRKTGGGVFSGAGYPHKIPGVTGGREARAMGGKAKGKGKTNINIVIAAGKTPGADAGILPPGAMPKPPGGMPIPVPQGGPGGPQGGPPMPMPVPMPMPAAPAGGPAGGPPMGRKSGGRIKKYIGGASSSSQDYPGNFAYPEEDKPQPTPQYRKPTDAEVKAFMDQSVANISRAMENQPGIKRKAGGRISKVAKSYKDMTAGAGSGEGRLQKTDIAKRSPRKAGGGVYRSYKDMDAGAGSGFGRLEKTEIAKRKK